jgi:predicted enzyme related to lactoylglutathione lyase
MNQHEKINYVEFPVRDLTASKCFFSQVFDWEFVDYGDEYSAFSNQGLDGGFYQSDLNCSSLTGSALVIFYSDDLEATQDKITEAGGLIVQDTFTFPGGRRFHFTDPSGNEFAVWSDKDL